jgi:integrase
VIALTSKLCSLAMQWKWRADNPCRGIERNVESKRKRYLSAAELERLSKALAGHDDPDSADIFRLLLLTGARRGEVQAARWSDFDLETGIWTKPGATTKQRTEHIVPLNAPARQLIAGRERTDSEYLFPGRHGGHRVELKSNWRRVCKAAGIGGLRIHDLRHSFASQLASAGVGLHVIGGLLDTRSRRRLTDTHTCSTIRCAPPQSAPGQSSAAKRPPKSCRCGPANERGNRFRRRERCV